MGRRPPPPPPPRSAQLRPQRRERHVDGVVLHMCGGSEYLKGDACGVWSASGRLNIDTHATRSWWRGR
eukprot:6331258-Prymnesium_polylepis.1